ncbi:DUF5777 family beta-barrel protein [Runella sp.]|uniref:DUF5777 family beta-barrel protein n=1 Tax=Runella sp. TaxID=1960881 RepID=UPI003D0A4984
MKRIFILSLILTVAQSLYAQDDLMSILDKEKTGPVFTTATFKSTRIINGQSVETIAKKHLDFRISHRFGAVNSGFTNLWGLDEARIRIGLEYGITDRLMVGVGRSSYQKTYDYFAKYKLLRQSNRRFEPVSITAYAGAFTNATPTSPDMKFYNNLERQSYVGQLLIARKFGERFSLQLSPTILHRNKTETTIDENTLYATGIGGRFKLTKRTSFNAEYFYTLKQIGTTYVRDPQYKDCFSMGFDIETGGHVFQLHLSNSRGMIENQFIGATTGSWSKGDIFYGFNISRVFSFDKSTRTTHKK